MPIILTPRTRGSHFSFWAAVVWVSMVLWNMLKWRPKGSGKLPKHILQERNRGIWISVLLLLWTWKAFLQPEHKINNLFASFNLFFLSHKQSPNVEASEAMLMGKQMFLPGIFFTPWILLLLCNWKKCYSTKAHEELKIKDMKTKLFSPHLSGFVGINPTAAGSLQLGHC